MCLRLITLKSTNSHGVDATIDKHSQLRHVVRLWLVMLDRHDVRYVREALESLLHQNLGHLMIGSSRGKQDKLLSSGCRRRVNACTFTVPRKCVKSGQHYTRRRGVMLLGGCFLAVATGSRPLLVPRDRCWRKARHDGEGRD